jgi:hypothetical protein
MRPRIPDESTEDEAGGERAEIMRRLRRAYPAASVRPAPWSPESILIDQQTEGLIESTVWVWITLDGRIYVHQARRFECQADDVVSRVGLALAEAML